VFDRLVLPKIFTIDCDDCHEVPLYKFTSINDITEYYDVPIEKVSKEIYNQIAFTSEVLPPRFFVYRNNVDSSAEGFSLKYNSKRGIWGCIVTDGNRFVVVDTQGFADPRHKGMVWILEKSLFLNNKESKGIVSDGDGTLRLPYKIKKLNFGASPFNMAKIRKNLKDRNKNKDILDLLITSKKQFSLGPNREYNFDRLVLRQVSVVLCYDCMKINSYEFGPLKEIHKYYDVPIEKVSKPVYNKIAYTEEPIPTDLQKYYKDSHSSKGSDKRNLWGCIITDGNRFVLYDCQGYSDPRYKSLVWIPEELLKHSADNKNMKYVTPVEDGEILQLPY